MSHRSRSATLAILLIIVASVLMAGWRKRNAPGSQSVFQLRREASAQSAPASGCSGSMNIGFRIKTFAPGVSGAVWYPTTSAEKPYSYPGRYTTSMAENSPVASCGQPFPLIVFSHGFSGCSVQSMFFTETLAHAGYIVAAPDHKDSMCKADEGLKINWAEVEYLKSQKVFNENSYRNRGLDVKAVIDDMLRDPDFAPHIDANRIAGAGHSLGGYTILAMAGGWPSWKDSRIKAALLMSPYVVPFLESGGLRRVTIPLMYQGGTSDTKITPNVSKPGGAYEVSNPPKYFVEFKGAGHLTWSNMACVFHKNIPACAANVENPRLINSYALAFFNHYLKGMSEPMLDQSNLQLADMRHAEK